MRTKLRIHAVIRIVIELFCKHILMQEVMNDME